MKTRSILILLVLAASAALPTRPASCDALKEKRRGAVAKRAAAPEAPVPVVSVVRAEVSDFVETLFS